MDFPYFISSYFDRNYFLVEYTATGAALVVSRSIGIFAPGETIYLT